MLEALLAKLSILAMPFAVKALLCGVLIGAVCSLFGIFVTLNKMAFFSESVSHASLTGIAIALFLGFDPSVFLIFFSAGMAAVIALVSQSSIASKDSIIGIVHSATIAAGIILLGLLRGGMTDISRFLFGDIYALRTVDIYICAGLFVFSMTYLYAFWKTHLTICVAPEFAVIEGIPVKSYDFMLMIAIALVIAVAVKIVGAILVTALLVIPPNAAKNVAGTFSGFRSLSIIFGTLCSAAGVVLSVFLDLPAGPSIIVVNAAAYFATLFMRGVN